jgi:hypothetical protein
LASLVGAGLGLLLRGLESVRPRLEPFSPAGVIPVLEVLVVVPGLAAAVLVPRSGSLFLALLASQAVRLLGDDPVVMVAGLAQAGLVALLPEAWLSLRPRDRGPLTMTVAGGLLGLSSALVGLFFAPATVSSALAPAAIVGAAAGGAAIGWAVQAAGAAVTRNRAREAETM